LAPVGRGEEKWKRKRGLMREWGCQNAGAASRRNGGRAHQRELVERGGWFFVSAAAFSGNLPVGTVSDGGNQLIS